VIFSGRVHVDVILKSLSMRVGELSDGICNCLDPKITMKATISNVQLCFDNTL
jgi:hypothetical protein